MQLESRVASPTPNQKLNMLTLRASVSSPVPSRREIRVPPPTPTREARQSSILNTGRISDAPASI